MNCRPAINRGPHRVFGGKRLDGVGVKVTVAQRQCRVGLVSPPLESEVDTCSGHDQVGLPEPSGRRPLGCFTGMAPPNQGVG